MGDDKTIEILLVEDNPGDVRLTSEAFKERAIATRLSVVDDGDEALAFLLREGKHASAPRPDLILLDLNLPKSDGLDVLRSIKANPSLCTIPVIVLSSSTLSEDSQEAYASSASAFVSKPVDLNEYIEMIHGISDRWVESIARKRAET